MSRGVSTVGDIKDTSSVVGMLLGVGIVGNGDCTNGVDSVEKISLVSDHVVAGDASRLGD